MVGDVVDTLSLTKQKQRKLVRLVTGHCDREEKVRKGQQISSFKKLTAT